MIAQSIIQNCTAQLSEWTNMITASSLLVGFSLAIIFAVQENNFLGYHTLKTLSSNYAAAFKKCCILELAKEFCIEMKRHQNVLKHDSFISVK